MKEYSNNNYEHFSRPNLHDEPVILDWMTEKVFIMCGVQDVKIVDFRKDIREKPSIYHSIVKLMNDNYLKRNDDNNISLKESLYK